MERRRRPEPFGRGDVPFVLERIAPEVEWIETEAQSIAPEVEWIETEAQSIPTNGRSSTPEEVLQNGFAKVPEHFETFELRPQLWIEKGEDVVVTGRVRARTRSGRDLDSPYAHVFTLRDGKVTRNDNFHDTVIWAEALAP